MKVLLDTHAFLWALVDPGKLSSKARQMLEDETTDVVASAISACEIATKLRLGKLPGAQRVVSDYTGALQGLQATELVLTSAHALRAGAYPQLHRDPFDRMLAAQSALEKVALVSCNPLMSQFDIEVIW